MKELLINLFTNNNLKYSFTEIKNNIINVKGEKLKTALEKLELEGKIYYDNKTKYYYPFPSNFFITNIKSINDDSIIVRINSEDITLPLVSNLKQNQNIIIGINSKGSYYFVKGLKNQPTNSISYEREILNMFYPLEKGLTLNEIKEYIKNNLKQEKKDTIPLTSKEIKKINKVKKLRKKEHIKTDSPKIVVEQTPLYQLKELKELLKELEKLGILYYNEELDTYAEVNSNYLITTVNQSIKKNVYYITLNNKKIMLPKKMLQDILPYDKILLKKGPKGWDLIKIFSRANPNIVCEITPNGLHVVGNKDLKIRMNNSKLKELALPVGTRILGQISTVKTNGYYDITYLETLGHKDDFNADLEAIAYNNGFITRYTKQELDQVNTIPTEVSDEEKIGRIDLTKENIFTIDGIYTKDFDDAVSIKLLDNGNYELSVSIADVNHYIKYGSPLWQRAEKNTSSLYLINSVSHMLHPKISNGICSLNPGEDRLAKTYVMEIDSQGKILNFTIHNSVINSKMRMTYEDVNQIFEENNIPIEYEKFIPDLIKMQELSLILTKRHQKDGCINFGNKEIRFILDDEGNIINIETVHQGTAEKIIENFMIATNESMAEYMLNLGITFIYRNHEIPFDDKILETTKLIKTLGYRIEKLKNASDPHVIQKIIQSLSSKEEFFILSALLLKSMKKAYFSTENKGHYALALNAYSQTTSPIRRFLDLLIEYILDNLEEISKPDYPTEKLKVYISSMCKHASLMERLAAKAEYEADKLYMINYCALHSTQEYLGFISDITPRYIVVKTKSLIEGIIYFDDINNGNYIYNPDTKWLENPNSKERLFIGTKLNIILKDYNKEYRTIYFKGTTLNEKTLKRKKG